MDLKEKVLGLYKPSTKKEEKWLTTTIEEEKVQFCSMLNFPIS
jgi:hypothetical protein